MNEQGDDMDHLTADHLLTDYRNALEEHLEEQQAAPATAEDTQKPQDFITVGAYGRLYACRMRVMQMTNLSHALRADEPIGSSGDMDYPEHLEKCTRAVALMRESGELAARERLYQALIREVSTRPAPDLVQSLVGRPPDDQPNDEYAWLVSHFNQYWNEAQRIAEEYRSFYETESFSPKLGRTGPKPQIKSADQARLPMTEYVKDALMGLGRGEFTPTEGMEAVFTEIGKAQVRIECDSIGFDALRAVEMLAAYGPATMQTFLGLMGLWIDNNPGASHETYYTARASDLMRYMRRQELPSGGYHTKDQMQKGREVYILSRATIPRATVKRVNSNNGQRTVETVVLDQLLHVQNMTVQRTLEGGQEIQSILEFRYHPNKEIHGMLCGDTPQFAEVSGKLLGYHTVTHKYHILLGFGLAFYDKVNRRRGGATRKIALPALLQLSGVDVPKTNVDRFLEQIQKAIQELGADGVISGAQTNIPQDVSLSARQRIALATVTFPVLLVTQRQLAPAQNPS